MSEQPLIVVNKWIYVCNLEQPDENQDVFKNFTHGKVWDRCEILPVKNGDTVVSFFDKFIPLGAGLWLIKFEDLVAYRKAK